MNKLKQYLLLFLILFAPMQIHAKCGEMRGTGDLGVVIERANHSILIVDTSHPSILCQITGLGDLSHASVVYSKDQRYAYIFGRDGGLNKIDVLQGKLVNRIIQAGNSIGGAISEDGRWVATANYQPGGIKIFSADTLALALEIKTNAKVVGLVDAPKQQFIFSLWDTGEIWQVDIRHIQTPIIKKYVNIGKQPYDGLITPEGRYYIAGLFGESGLALLDLWQNNPNVKRILAMVSNSNALPVYKMPHLEGWALAGHLAFIPAVGQHQIWVLNRQTWQRIKTIEMAGQPVFAIANPNQRQIWVNFALPDNHLLQIINTQTLSIERQLSPGKGVLHMEFTPKGDQVWVSVRDEDKVVVYETNTQKIITTLPAQKPSGIFFTNRANKIGL